MEAPLQNYVNSVASAVCSSDIGAQWLSSYIDPAHGQCYVFPDEDTNYSCAIRTKNIQAINASTFVSSNYTGNVPDVFNFVIFSLPSPDVPIAIYGTFYFNRRDDSNQPTIPASEQRLVFITDPQWKGFTEEIQQARLLYKGFTLTYTGNAFQNQGFISSSTYTPVYGDGKVNNGDSGLEISGRYLIADYLPTTSRQVSLMNRDFEVFATADGVYGVNKYTGARSEYVDVENLDDHQNVIGFLPDASGTQYTQMKLTPCYKYEDRFSLSLYGYYYDFDCLCNWNVVAAAVDGMSSSQSLLLKFYQGSQIHFKPSSSLVSMQTYKGFLDNAAITAASQLNSNLACVYPSNYNDFRMIWGKIRGFLKSNNGRNLVSAISAAVGPYGSFINAAYSLL